MNRIQNVRKSKNFDITDKVVVTINPDDRVNDAVATFGDYIARQVLANDIKVEIVEGNDAIELDMDGWTLNIKVDKA